MTALESLFASMTLADLARFAGTTVAHVVELAYAGRGAAVAKASMTSKAKAGEVARGGMSLDAVLAAVASVGGPAKLEDVRVKVGGTVPQVRAALQKLAGAGKIAITGQRRGTRYAVR
jgi:hypothetical protein